MQAGNIDLLLIRPFDSIHSGFYGKKRFLPIDPPVWAGLIAAYAIGRRVSAAILDAEALELGPAEAAVRAVEIRPRLAAVVADDPLMSAAGAICQAIKEVAPHLHLLLIGGRAAALPERTLDEESADFVCTGEGPVTAVELAAALKSNSPRFSEVRGLMFRDNARRVQTKPSPLVADIDAEMTDLPWRLLPMDRYRAGIWQTFDELCDRSRAAAFVTSLGCPFDCDFCAVHARFRRGEAALGYPEKVNSYRRWSVDTVVGWIDTLVADYGVHHLRFMDDMFAYHRSHTMELLDRLIGRGHGVNLAAVYRPGAVDTALFAKMKQAGINWLIVEFESGARRIRRDMEAGFSPDHVFFLTEAIRSAGIHILGRFRFGFPEDDMDRLTDTFSLATALNVEFAEFHSVIPYPGTTLYDRAMADDRPPPASWSAFSPYGETAPPTASKHVSGEEVRRFRDRAEREYFDRAGYLSMIEKTFGPRVLSWIHDLNDRIKTE